MSNPASNEQQLPHLKMEVDNEGEGSSDDSDGMADLDHHGSSSDSESESPLLKFKCQHCTSSFARVSYLQSHLFGVHGIKAFFCTICDAKFESRNLLTDHRKEHFVGTSLNSLTSGTVIPIKNTLRRHARKHKVELEREVEEEDVDKSDYLSTLKGSGEFTCDKCSEAFPRQHLLRVHLNKIHGENAFPCGICGASLASRTSLTEHKKVHLIDGAFKCETCGASIVKYDNFIRHLRIHTGSKNFVCEWCASSFNTAGDLKRHVRKHTGEKPYSCEECGECFARLYGLSVHKNKHIGRIYKCTEQNCDKAFYSKSALNNHLKSHLPDRPFKCHLCKARFYMVSHWKDHLRTHSGERPHVCDTCGKAFGRNTELVIHQRTHTGERPYRCTVCGKGFTQSGILSKHLLIHSTDRPFKCEHCDSAFKDLSVLRKHMQKIHNKLFEDSRLTNGSFNIDVNSSGVASTADSDEYDEDSEYIPTDSLDIILPDSPKTSSVESPCSSSYNKINLNNFGKGTSQSGMS